MSEYMLWKNCNRGQEAQRLQKREARRAEIAEVERRRHIIYARYFKKLAQAKHQDGG